MSLLEERRRWWLGRTVIARSDTDGIYYPGETISSVEHLTKDTAAIVKEELKQQLYEVQWADNTTQPQSIQHIFGPHSVNRSLQPGDYVLALAMTSEYNCIAL